MITFKKVSSLGVCSFVIFFQMESALAKHANQEIRPSYLINTELATTQGANQLLGTAFFSNTGRIAYGLTRDLEIRADLSIGGTLGLPTGTTTSNLVYSDGLTLKYHLFDWTPVRFAAKAKFMASGSNLMNTSVTTLLGSIPIDLNAGFALFTVVPRVSSYSYAGASTTVLGFDGGTEIPLTSTFSLAGEVYFSSATITGATTTAVGVAAGFVWKPYSFVTVPVVLCTNPAASDLGTLPIPAIAYTSVGLLDVIAHVGIAL